jgi:hypothetical protein
MAPDCVNFDDLRDICVTKRRSILVFPRAHGIHVVVLQLSRALAAPKLGYIALRGGRVAGLGFATFLLRYQNDPVT